MTPASTRLRMRADLMLEEMDDDFLVYRPGATAAHLLNASAAATLLLCDGTHGQEEIVATLAASGVQDADLAGHVGEFLTTFRDLHYLHAG